MDCLEETYRNLLKYFEGKSECYEKKEGSSYKGIIADDKETGLSEDIRLTKNGMLIYEAYPGIIVNKEHMEATVMYCQSIGSRFGTVYVKEQNRNVLFHAETSFKDNPVNEVTIKMIEEEADEVLHKHIKNIEMLSCGHGLEVRPVENTEENKKTSISEGLNLKENIEVCRAFLAKSGHNSICENLNKCNNVVFFSQMLTNDEVYRFKYIFDENSGMLSVTAEFGEKSFVIRDEYKYSIGMIMNHYNSKFACGNLRFNDNGSYNVIISLSLMDGALSEDTYEYIERSLVSILHESHSKIERVGHGGLVELKDESEDISKEVRDIIAEELEAAGNRRLSNIPTFEEFMKSRGMKLPDIDFLSFDDVDNNSNDEDSKKEETVYSMEDCYDEIDAILNEENSQDGNE